MTLGVLEVELIEINANSEKLQHGYNELVEYKLVLQKVYLILKLHMQTAVIEFFKLAESSVAARQRELSSDQAAEESLETPLLKDQALGLHKTIMYSMSHQGTTTAAVTGIIMTPLQECIAMQHLDSGTRITKKHVHMTSYLQGKPRVASEMMAHLSPLSYPVQRRIMCL